VNAGSQFVGAGLVGINSPRGSTARVTVNGDVTFNRLEVASSGRLRVLGTLRSPNTIRNFGSISGTGNIVANLLNLSNILPGLSPGILTITGNYPQDATGTLVLEIGGTRPGIDYDQLKVTGLATLAGQVEVVLVNGFTPRPADRFRTLDFAQQTGSLTPTNLAFELLANGRLKPMPLKSGVMTGNGSIRANKRSFRFDVSAASLRGKLRYVDTLRQLTLISTGLTRVQIEATGRRGLIQGTALLNGQNGYRFTVWVEDRGSGLIVSRDRFRILIEGPDGFRYDSKNYPPVAGTLHRGDLRVRPTL